MLDNFNTGRNEPPFLFSVYEIYCTYSLHTHAKITDATTNDETTDDRDDNDNLLRLNEDINKTIDIRQIASLT